MDFNPFTGLGMEAMRISYQRFYTMFHTRRIGQAPKKIDDFTELAMPIGSVVHTIGNMETLEPEGDCLPTPHFSPIDEAKAPRYILIYNQIADEHSKPLPVKENLVFRPTPMMAGISYWYQHHRDYKKIMVPRTIGTMPGTITRVDYSPIMYLKTPGVNEEYRKFDVIFRTILNSIESIGTGCQHFLFLPQNEGTTTKAAFVAAAKELSNSTMAKLRHDPTLFPLVHILGYVLGRSRRLNVTPYKTDLKLLGKDHPSLRDLRSSSLLERIPTDVLKVINIVLYKGRKAVIYNLGDIIEFSNDPGFFGKLYTHFMTLRHPSGDFIDMETDPHEETGEIEEQGIIDSETSAPIEEKVKELPKEDKFAVKHDPADAAGGYLHDDHTTPVSQVVVRPIELGEQDTKLEDHIRTHVDKVVAEKVAVEPKKEARKRELVDNHFNVTIGGKTLSELIQEQPPESFKPKKMDFLTGAPEESHKQSTLVAIDKAYQEKMYHADLAKVLASTAKHGLFITHIEEEHHSTEMDKTTTYKVSMRDIDGRSHTIKFSRPTISKDGTITISGTEYILTRQAVTLPICKISDSEVSLSSHFGKVLVSRVESKRNSFEHVIIAHILKLRAEGMLTAQVGKAEDPVKPLPYDYSAISKGFTEITVGGMTFYFGQDGAPITDRMSAIQKVATSLSSKFGIFVGITSDMELLFWDFKNSIRKVSHKGEELSHWKSFNQLLVDVLGSEAGLQKQVNEYTLVSFPGEKIPLVFTLGYEMGLENLFKKINLQYRFYSSGNRPVIGIDDISIRFADGFLVFNRYPLQRSLIAAGLTWADLKDINFKDLNFPAPYTKVLVSKKMKPGTIQTVTQFVDFFVDPITETVLRDMSEPTVWSALLLRANMMVTDYYAIDTASIANHRFRKFERWNGIVYESIFKEFSRWRRTNGKKSFSINPEDVFQKIVQDATVAINDTINPIHEVKQSANYTFTGRGGRSADAITQESRIYPKDGLGIVSDAVPDSGKVGITSYLSASPNIDNVHGIPKAYKEGDELEAPQMLAIGTNVMPGGTTDDGKRASYLSIQISHYVPNHGDGETASVRTGYDAVLPHLVSDTFAIAAEADGVVESIDEKAKVLRVRYADKPIDPLRKLTLPYSDPIIDKYRKDHNFVGILVTERSLGSYPANGIFALTNSTYGKVVSRLRCDSVDGIPDRDLVRKQSQLVKALSDGSESCLYYIRLELIGTTTPGEVKSYSYKDAYSQISGAFLLQTRKVNVHVGEKIKEGDILIYNDGFFVPDPMSKQVTFKHGIIETVALCEKGSNHEDACEITRAMANRLNMTPAHQCPVVTQKNAILISTVKPGDHVDTTTPLCVISDDVMVQTELYQTQSKLDLMAKLSRQTPTAGYTGTVSKLRILYACDRNELSDSLKSILKVYEKEERQQNAALSAIPGSKISERPGYVAPGTYYKGIEFTEDTVLLEYMIQETLTAEAGDKLCFGNANKAIISHVSEESHYTESGVPVGALFSLTSIINRIVKSPLLGIAERNMEVGKAKLVDIFFNG